MERIIHFAIRNRWVVVAVTAGLAVLGIYNFSRLPIDAVPDITNVQVQVNTEAPGMSPLEIWCNEAQERYVLIVAAPQLAAFGPSCAEGLKAA